LKGLSLLVTESTDGREVAVVASGPTDGLEFHELSLKLTGAGAYAAVKAFSCVDVVQNRPIAGIACLATDETAVTLDVEVYDGLTPEGDAYFARLQLGPSGLRLTKSLLANQERHPHATSLVVQPVAPHDFYGIAGSVIGNLDAYGSRQGLWQIVSAEGTRMLAMHWNDGLPNGPFVYYANGLLPGSCGFMRFGFQDGPHMLWMPTECLVETWVNGTKHGPETAYDARGARLREVTYENGSIVGSMRTWTPDKETSTIHPLARQPRELLESFADAVRALRTRGDRLQSHW
jgi:hypothetical protein